MIITKVEVEQFGKWKNFTLDFTGGVNVIEGHNEAGKSTLCAFIFAVFYGLPNESKKLGIREDVRKRYLPWDGGAMSGSIHFTSDGRSYVLSRKLGKTRRGDKVSLKDGETWEEITDIAPEEIGSAFLGIGEEGFLKTLFISQLGTAIAPGGDDEILKRLSNLKQSGDEDTSYQAAAAALQKAQFELLSKSEKAGMIPRLEQESAELERELNEAKRLSGRFREDILAQTRLTQESERLSQEAKALTAQKQLAREHVRYKAACKAEEEKRRLDRRLEENAHRIEEQKRELQKSRENLKNFQTVEHITQEKLLELAQLEKDLAGRRERAEAHDAKKARLAELEQKYEEQKGKKQGGINIFMLVVACIVAAMGVGFGIFASPVLLFLLPVGALLGVVSFIGRIGGREQKDAVAELEQAINVLRSEVESEKTDADAARMKECESELTAALSAAGAADLPELARRMEEWQTCRRELKEAENRLSLLTEAGKQLEEDARRFPQQQAEVFPPEVIAYSGLQETELDAALAENHRKQLEAQRACADASHRVASAFSGVRSADVIASELEQKEERLRQCRSHYGALCMAQKVMEESYLEIKKDFAPALNERTGKILSMLTNGKYNELKIADDYKVMLREQEGGQVVSAEYLSGGTYDVLYFALRLAIAQVLFPGGIPLLILDDAFLQLDDARAAAAATFLLESSGAEQILYFTCHKSQGSLFGDGSNHILL